MRAGSFDAWRVRWRPNGAFFDVVPMVSSDSSTRNPLSRVAVVCRAATRLVCAALLVVCAGCNHGTARVGEVALWLRSDHGLQLDRDGRVESWLDQSSDRRVLRQPATKARPIVSDAPDGGRRWVHFDSIDDVLAGEERPLLDGDDVELIVALRCSECREPRVIVAQDQGAGARPKWIWWLRPQGLTFEIQPGAVAVTVRADWNLQRGVLLSFKKSGARYCYSRDGVPLQVGFASLSGTNARGPLTVGAAEARFFLPAISVSCWSSAGSSRRRGARRSKENCASAIRRAREPVDLERP